MFGSKRPYKNDYSKKLLFICSAALILLFGNVFYAEAILYDWNDGTEGFKTVAPEITYNNDGEVINPGWHWQDGANWGVKGNPTLSSFNFITDLKNQDAIDELNSFLFEADQMINIKDLVINIDVYKHTEAVWETGYPYIDLFLNYNGVGYHYGSLLTQSNGWETGIQLSYLGSGSYFYSPLSIQLSTNFDPAYPNNNGEYGINLKIDNLTLNPVPEPASMLLLGSGLLGLTGFRRKFRKK